MTGEATEEGLPRNLKLWQYRAYCLCREQHALIDMFLETSLSAECRKAKMNIGRPSKGPLQLSKRDISNTERKG